MREPWYKQIPLVWPIVVSALALTITAASADTRLGAAESRIQYLYDNGAPSEAARLARIEERQVNEDKTLDRMEDKLDDIDARQSQGTH